MFSTSTTDDTTPTAGVDDAATVAFRQLVVCEKQQPRRPTELVTFAVRLVKAVLGPSGATFDAYLAETCQLDETGRLIGIAEKDEVRFREVFMELLEHGCEPEEPGGQPLDTSSWRLFDSCKMILRLDFLGRSVYAYWRADHPNASTPADGSMGKMWCWMSDECDRRGLCDRRHDRMKTIKDFIDSCVDKKFGNDIDGEEAAASATTVRATAPLEARATKGGCAKTEMQPSEGKATEFSRKRKRKRTPTSSHLSSPPAAPATTTLSPTSAETTGRTGTRTGPEGTTGHAKCTSCVFLRKGLEGLQSEKEKIERRAAQEVAVLQREVAQLRRDMEERDDHVLKLTVENWELKMGCPNRLLKAATTNANINQDPLSDT